MLTEVRVVVEQRFAELRTNFAMLNFSKAFVWDKMAISHMFFASVLFSNCRVCLESSSKASDLFQVDPPTLNEYLNPMYPLEIQNFMDLL